MEELYVDDMAMIDVVLAVCAERETTAVIVRAVTADKRLSYLTEFNGILAKDNYFTQVPEQPGIYLCQASYFYQPPDEWEYVIVNSIQIL